MPSNTQRPLSPHLQVYRPQLTSVTSILHRMTGVALNFGTLLVAWFLVAAGIGEEAFNIARDFFASPLGLFMIFGWTVSLYYHLFNGIRHLIWDTGRLFKLKDAYRAAYVVFLCVVLATGATWHYGYFAKNAAGSPAEPAMNTEAQQ